MQCVLTSSLEKVLGDSVPAPAEQSGGAHVSGFLGEVLSFQLGLLVEKEEVGAGVASTLAGTTPTDAGDGTFQLQIQCLGDRADLVDLYVVRRVPVSVPAPEAPDEHYLSTEPGEYPDLLEPVQGAAVSVTLGRWESVWVDVRPRELGDAGDHELTLRVTGIDGGATLAEATAAVRVHPHHLPPLTLTNTHWFHADSIATYYEVDVFSDRHWELIERFLASAREMDVNSVLTPTWTPPLDTAEGHRRPVVQLIDIRDIDGEYSFGFERLDRWLEICRRLGFTGIEVAHLFTQWGARCTPAVQVQTAEDAEERFGWHVAATSSRYRRLLEAMIPALRQHLASAWDGDVLWHVSDEPRVEHLDGYRAAKEQVSDLLEGERIVDALSSFSYAEQGLVDTPIVATDHVEPFLEAGWSPWVYYCVSQTHEVANRFIALPSVRNRVLGRQLFVFDAPGFLHWGFNFWWSQYALETIDPFKDTCAGGAFFGGDAFVVYPGPEGTPWPSIRHRVSAQSMADHRALTWLAELTDRPSAKQFVDEAGTLTYSSFSYDANAHLRTRQAVDERIMMVLAAPDLSQDEGGIA